MTAPPSCVVKPVSPSFGGVVGFDDLASGGFFFWLGRTIMTRGSQPLTTTPTPEAMRGSVNVEPPTIELVTSARSAALRGVWLRRITSRTSDLATRRTPIFAFSVRHVMRLSMAARSLSVSGKRLR